MSYLPEFFAVAALHLLAVMSPGPDFILVTNNSMSRGKKAGMGTAAGLALGILVHVTYCLAGIAYVISRSIVVFSVIKTAGAVYLMYVGYKAIKARPTPDGRPAAAPAVSAGFAVWQGFLTNILNPKVTLFFLAVFTQVIHRSTPNFVKGLYGLEMAVMTFVWFASVSFLFSLNSFRAKFARIQHRLQQTMGGLLIALGLKVALSRTR